MNFFITILNLSSEILEEKEGFGFNGNILETNVLNLAVVLGIVIFFVGQNLLSTLDNRKETILSNLREANLRANEAKEKFNKAKELLQSAEKKALEIRKEGVLKKEKEQSIIMEQFKLDLTMLDQFKQETLSFYQQKAFQQIYISLLKKALNLVQQKFQKPLYSENQFHTTLNNIFIARLTEFNAI